MSIQLDPIITTPIHLLSNDAWCDFTAVIIALLLWAFDKPTSQRGRHCLFPIWLILIIFTSIGALCLFFNQLFIGKLFIIIELIMLLFITSGVLFVYIITHIFGFRLLREGNIHEGIGPGNYF
ncbi:MAG TPA: hypothetical protein PLP19_21585 [bacterium]|nr:hypothetical protein [bacterium]HPN46091.1 hypothetical protein [bacterium]